MNGLSQYNSTLIGRKTQAKFENYCISRYGHSMMLLSFSSTEDALFNDVKHDTFSSQGTENPPLRKTGNIWYTYIF